MTAPIGGALSGIGGALGDTGARSVPVISSGSGSFGDTLKKALGDVSAAQDRSSDTLGAFLRGEPVELHQVMAASEEAGIALEMLIEVRNKFLDAYRTLTTMQG